MGQTFPSGSPAQQEATLMPEGAGSSVLGSWASFGRTSPDRGQTKLDTTRGDVQEHASAPSAAVEQGLSRIAQGASQAAGGWVPSGRAEFGGEMGRATVRGSEWGGARRRTGRHNSCRW